MHRNKWLWGSVLVLLVVIAVLSITVAAFDLAVEVALLVGTAAASVTSLFISKQLETRVMIEQDLRKEKIDVYDKLISTLFEMMLSGRREEGVQGNQKLKAAMADVSKGLVFWGSNEVIETYGDMRKESLSGKKIETIVFNDLFESLLTGMRRDFGHHNQ